MPLKFPPFAADFKNFGKTKIVFNGNEVSIETKRLRLLSLNQESLFKHIDNYRDLLRKPENIQMFRNGEPWTIKDVVKFLETQNAKWDESLFSSFAVYDKALGTFIGTLNLYWKKDDYKHLGYENVVEIGYVLDCSKWRQRIGTELAFLAKLYVQYLTALFSNKNSSEPCPTAVVATAHPENEPSVKILERIFNGEAKFSLKKFGGQPRLFFSRALVQLPQNTQPEQNVCNEQPRRRNSI